MLTYFGRWDFVESDIDYELARKLYIAPGEYRAYSYTCTCTCMYLFMCISMCPHCCTYTMYMYVHCHNNIIKFFCFRVVWFVWGWSCRWLVEPRGNPLWDTHRKGTCMCFVYIDIVIVVEISVSCTLKTGACLCIGCVSSVLEQAWHGDGLR